MQTRCCNCFQVFDDIGGMCPFCGHIKGDMGTELNYLVPGTELKDGHYTVGEVLGAGGFGIVYRAWDLVLDRMIAIKEYYPVQMVARTPGERSVAVYSNKKEGDYVRGLNKFKTEALIMSEFNESRYVCNAYDRFDENGTSYIVMEFLPRTLKSYAKEKGRLEEKEILNIAEQILLGLEEIHKKDVVHRDIAPDNVFLMPDGRAKLNDFGAAFQKKRLDGEEDIALKPGYAPPEQYRRNGKVGPWTDLYAAGATIYWLLTGKVPLEATDREREDTLQSPYEVAGVTQSVSNVVMRSMAIRPELRYKSAREFIEELKKENARSVEAELKRRKRKRVGFLLAVAAVLVGAILGGNAIRKEAGTIREDKIVVWISSEENAQKTAEKQERYEDVTEQFEARFPQLDVEIVVKEEAELQSAFLNSSQKERPDLVESTYVGEEVLALCSDLAENVSQYSENLSEGVMSYFSGSAKKQMPTGRYVTVIYAEKGQDITTSLVQHTYHEFLTGSGQGFCNADSSKYFEVQNTLAGRYQMLEATDRKVVFTEYFSVYKRTANKEKAAMALLEYLLTDAAQDILHVQNHSGRMPINKNAWSAYLGVYKEFEYLREKLDREYTVLSEKEYKR